MRQGHILDPWYNMNRLDQIIGRGVRNLSHCLLPYHSRNVELYLYGTELWKAKEVKESYNKEGNRHWFSTNNGKLFTVPHSRSDYLIDAWRTTPRIRPNYKAKTKQIYKEGIVYPKKSTRTFSEIPDKIKLTRNF